MNFSGDRQDQQINVGSWRHLRGNFSYAFIGQAVYALCSWLILLVLARLGDAASVGRFALALAVTTPILLFANLYLSVVQATDAGRDHSFGIYLALRLLTTAIALIFIGALVGFFGFARETAMLVCIVGLAKAFDALADICIGLFMQRNRLDLMATTLILNGVLSLAALSGAIALTQDVRLAALGSMIGSMAACIWASIHGVRLLRPAGEQLRPVWNFAEMGRLARLSFPLGFTSLRLTLYISIPRYFVAALLGDSALGIFATLTTLSLGVGVLLTALFSSTAAQLSQQWAFGNKASFLRAVRQLLGISAAIGACQVIGALVVGNQLIASLLPPEYAVGTDLLVWLTLSAMLLFVVAASETALIAARAISSQVEIQIISAIVLVLSCAALIPRFGLLGATWAMGAGTLAGLVGNYLALRRSSR